MSLRFKVLSSTQTPPTTQKALGLWKLLKSNPFTGLSVPDKVFYGFDAEEHLPIEHTQDEELGFLFAEDCPTCKNGLSAENLALRKGWLLPTGDGNALKPVGKVFGRPCPQRPRHGFVDSTEVSSMEDILALYDRAKKADDKAEILVMPFLEAICSAVFIPESGILIIGPEHNGATAGRESVTLFTNASTVSDEFRTSAGIEADQNVYAELLGVEGKTGKQQVVVVQARSGPSIPVGITEYIPVKTVVTNIIEPTDDLLAWESLTEALSGAKGVVAWKAGGSLGEHAAIHCRSRKIPYLTRRDRPLVGDTIIPPDAVKPVFDVLEFQTGVRAAEKVSNLPEGLTTAIAILHNIIPLEYSPQYSRLLGFSQTLIFRAAAAACLGEARHFKEQKSNLARNAIYEKAVEMTCEELCKQVVGFSHKFMHSSWGPSYGGWKWFCALIEAVKLWNNISYSRHEQAIETSNSILNMAHNGGWLFNKFIQKSVMDSAQVRPAEAMAASIVKLYKVVKEEQIGPSNFVKPRMNRAAEGWKWEVSPSETGTLQVTVQNLLWKPLVLNTEARRVLQDLFKCV